MSYIRFTWDDKKNAGNIRYHGVPFEEAQTVFNDPDHSQDEDRFILLGLSREIRVLVISHTYRENDEIIRIISARKANRNEQRQYESLRGV